MYILETVERENRICDQKTPETSQINKAFPKALGGKKQKAV